MDKSNFFKLAKSEREQLQDYGEICIDDNGNIVNDGHKLKKYMEDLLPCAYGYLKNIERDIKAKELPYVMSIEGGFGSGKTHFVTRLCQYLRDDGINAIYFNAFEYDNTIDPKLAILDAISKEHGENSLLNKLHQTFETLKKSISINCMGTSIDLAKLHLKDEIQKIKGELQNIRSNKRLVLIIDELDRCDPRFCVNLLEILKHFFDLDGLFTILSFSDQALLAALSNTYGSDFIKNNSENYLVKFIDHRTRIYEADNIGYSVAISKFFQDSSRKVDKEYLNEVSSVFSRMRLSLREVKRYVERIISLMESSSAGRNLKLYAYIACRCDKDFDKVANMKYIDDYDLKEELLFKKRYEQWEEFLNNYHYRERQSNENIRYAYVEIDNEFYIERYIIDYISYDILQNDIRSYYQVICKDSGNAKKLAEVFLSDLFEKINDTLTNTKQSRL